MRLRAALGVFTAYFGLYVWTLPPSLAAYRDAGEMVLAAKTLGICHPPSYPLYVLLGKLAVVLMPIATPAYAVNLLSAAAAAAALAVFVYALLPRYGLWAALGAASLLGLNTSFWDVATVQEMYSLTMLFACILLALGLRLRENFAAREWYCAAFLTGLFLGNRTDLLLWVPGMMLLALPQNILQASWKERGLFVAKTGAFGLLGLSIYLYLPLRSLQGPMLDWNHPAVWENFVGSITRKGYGGTLDLLSKNYKTGEMFVPNLKVYGGHLWQNLWLPGLLLAGLGLWRGSMKDRKRLAGLGLMFLLSGPLFLFLANLPPNAHAMAIVDPHYLLSYLVLSVWVAAGIRQCLEFGPRLRPLGPTLLIVCLLTPLVLGRWQQRNRRMDFVNRDYLGNVLRSAPRNSVVVAKKDIQLFGLWYRRYVIGDRPDLEIVPQGLSHSAWYQASAARFGSPLNFWYLKSREGWIRFKKENPDQRIYATNTAEYYYADRVGHPRGLLVEISSITYPSDNIWQHLVRRGDYRYEARPDFFTADLVGAHALARQHLGTGLLHFPAGGNGEKAYKDAWAMKWRSPETASHLGFWYFNRGNMSEALRIYGLSDLLYGQTMELADEYFALEEVRRSISLAWADALMNLGVVHEKRGDRGAAESSYLKALAKYPLAAKAHYNIAVLYWKKDWAKVVRELEAALRVDPNYTPAKRYLPAARQRLAVQQAR
jgi:tetratricopeptide (TPR) repeat protein